jgi:hypothetical protein
MGGSVKGNIFAGVLEGLGKALSGYGTSQMEQQNKEKLMGMKGSDPTSDIQNYNYYVQNAQAAGQKPVPFGKFIENKYKLLGGGRGGGGFDFGGLGGGGGVINVDE